jgi:hypothetical protein
MTSIAVAALIARALATHVPPNACSVLTTAQVSAAIGKPVTGGTMSIYNDPKSVTASCAYMSEGVTILVLVGEYPTPAAAKKQLADDLANSKSHDDESQKTTAEPGAAEGGYSVIMGSGTTVIPTFGAVRGVREITITATGPGVTVNQLRALTLTALGH